MTRLKKLVVENFRSIRGEVNISLDAPVVLIHGQNGTGKTSLLAALELALTRSVPSLERADPDYMQHLPHKAAPQQKGSIYLEGDIDKKLCESRIQVSQTAIAGTQLLKPSDSRFFSERCFLAQSTLSRLLEIYQHQDSRRSDSPLTKFVKELIGLDRLDALIEGLRPAGDVRRLREPAPAYWAAREQLPVLETTVDELHDQLAAKRQEVEEVREQIVKSVASLEETDVINVDDVASLASFVQTKDEDDLLLQLARVRRDLTAMSEQWSRQGGRPDEQVRAQAASALQQAQTRFDIWNRAHGALLQTLASRLDEMLGGPSQTAGLDPQPLWGRLNQLIASELSRIEKLNTQDAAHLARLAELNRSVAQARVRIQSLDAELGQLSDLNQQLAQALSNILPHVHSEDCPVCGRDFSEISRLPLAASLSKRIADLVQSAGRLQTLTRDRSSSVTAIAVAEREIGNVTARLLIPDVRDQLKSRQASLREMEQHVELSEAESANGQALIENWRAASKAITSIGEGDQFAVAVREQLATIAEQLLEEPPGDADDVGVSIQRLQVEAARWEEATVRRQSAKKLIAQRAAVRSQMSASIAIISKQIDTQRAAFESLSSAKGAADERIALAKDLSRRVRDARTEVVRRVFNDDLNSLWRSLFVRLAPDEPFVPAFALPSTPTGPVEAHLETIYRQGGKGGNPRAMLSAGNLNTAALTLFLALHLSAKPQLPWLIIDDPVQSMDEVHIAQFAAVLRNLSKVHGRQIILAVHERPLFDYLALELSPAFLGDRLITVELSRSLDGASTAVWEPRTFEPDRAIVAA